MAESDLGSVFWLWVQCYWPCLSSLRLFISWSCSQSCVSFVKSANTGAGFVCAKCWGSCGYCGEWIWVLSLSGLFPHTLGLIGILLPSESAYMCHPSTPSVARHTLQWTRFIMVGVYWSPSIHPWVKVWTQIWSLACLLACGVVLGISASNSHP